MKVDNKWFSLIEIIITIGIIAILWSGIILFNKDDKTDLNNFHKSIENRLSELNYKAQIWVNFYYSNSWITQPDYIKITCNNENKKLEWFICDNTNGCLSISFPSPDNFYWNNYESSFNWEMVCKKVLRNWTKENNNFIYNINLNFPYNSYFENDEIHSLEIILDKSQERKYITIK